MQRLGGDGGVHVCVCVCVWGGGARVCVAVCVCEHVLRKCFLLELVREVVSGDGSRNWYSVCYYEMLKLPPRGTLPCPVWRLLAPWITSRVFI